MTSWTLKRYNFNGP